MEATAFFLAAVTFLALEAQLVMRRLQ